MHNLKMNHNTFVHQFCCGTSTGGNEVSYGDLRVPNDLSDWTQISFTDNILWENGSASTTFNYGGITVTHTHNLVQLSTLNGTNPGTGAVNTNTVPFVAFDPSDTTPVGNFPNFNLTATAPGLNGASDGSAIGALQPPRLQSVVIANATPTRATWTFSTPFPLQLCTAGRFALSGLTITGCTVASNTTITTPFTGTVSVGQAITASLQQGAKRPGDWLRHGQMCRNGPRRVCALLAARELSL